jgi:hypothetical protein
MRAISKLILAGIVLGALTTTASAAVNLVSSTPFALGDSSSIAGGYTPGTLVWDFEGGINDLSNFSFTGGATSNTSTPNVAAEPAGDSSTYGYATGSNNVSTNPATFSVNSGFFKTFSIYLGSVDSYNTISFYDGSTLEGQWTGNELTNPTGNASGSQDAGITNGRFLFTFDGGTEVNKVVFDSTFPAFEFDNIAATISAVPEPATWAMMIIGFGFVGFMLRNGRRQGAAAVAA